MIFKNNILQGIIKREFLLIFQMYARGGINELILQRATGIPVRGWRKFNRIDAASCCEPFTKLYRIDVKLYSIRIHPVFRKRLSESMKV